LTCKTACDTASRCCGNYRYIVDKAMEPSNDQPVDAGVRFVPRLTEDSLPVTLPKDAEKSAEAPSASPEAPISFEPVRRSWLRQQLNSAHCAYSSESFRSRTSSCSRWFNRRTLSFLHFSKLCSACCASGMHNVTIAIARDHCFLQGAFRCSHWPESTGR